MSEFISLYSGSSGNSSVVRCGERYLIIDMGKGVRTTSAALKALDLNISDCAGILVTHEHSDHVKGLSTFLKKNPLPVYGAEETLGFLEENHVVPPSCDMTALPPGREAEIGGFGVTAFPAGHDVTFDIFADGQCFLPRSLYGRLDEFCGGDPHIAASLKRTRTPIDMDIDSKIDEVETLERIAMYWHDPADRDAIAAALDTLGGIEVTRSYAMNIEVMGEGATKGTALTWLCEHLGERLADAWAFGDNINDIPMLQAAGHGMAMINAEPEDREAADAITEYDNDHDGVARTIMAALA